MNSVMEKIECAERVVDDLCSGRLRWEMRVPAEPDHDPDLIISEALHAARSALPDLLAVVDAARAIVEGVDRLGTATSPTFIALRAALEKLDATP